jgi:hypothetical protein
MIKYSPKTAWWPSGAFVGEESKHGMRLLNFIYFGCCMHYFSWHNSIWYVWINNVVWTILLYIYEQNMIFCKLGTPIGGTGMGIRTQRLPIGPKHACRSTQNERASALAGHNFVLPVNALTKSEEGKKLRGCHFYIMWIPQLVFKVCSAASPKLARQTCRTSRFGSAGACCHIWGTPFPTSVP